MNDKWSQFAARNTWWLSGVAVLATFNLLMVLSSFWPRLFCYSDGDTLSEILPLGNIMLGIITIPSSISLFLVLKGTSSWRRMRLIVFGTVCALFWGRNLVATVLPDVFHARGHFPVEVDGIIFQGLLILWSLSLVFAALVWKPRTQRDEAAYESVTK